MEALSTPDMQPLRREPSIEGLHRPVLLAEVVELFAGLARPRVVVDGTVGLGGHAAALLEARGREIELYVAIDRDPEALAMARDRLRGFSTPILFQQASYTEIPKILEDEELPAASFLLLD